MSGAAETKKYAKFLLSVGNGTTEEGDLINMSEDMMTEQNSMEELREAFKRKKRKYIGLLPIRGTPPSPL